MANERSTIEILLEGKNLVSPHLKTVQADLKGTEAATVQAGQKGAASAAQIGTGFQQAGGQVKGFADGVAQGLGVALPLSLAAATTAVVAMGVSGVKSFADFDKAMRSVNTLTGQTGELAQRTFTENSKAIREFAVRMGVDATGAAQALYETISAGIPQGKEAFRVLEVGAKAAVGGLTTTKTAVDGLTTVLNGYKLTTADAGKISDQMFATVNRGKLTYDQLASSVGAVVPIAAAAGVSFAEVGGFMANMTLQGNTASVAANSLRQVITSIIKPTQEARDAAKFLGLDFSEAALRADGLAGFLGKVEKATQGDHEALGLLFSDIDGLKGVITAIGPNMEGFEGNIRAVGDATGDADRAFEEMNKSAQRNWDEMAAKANEVKLRIGEALIPVLTDISTFVDLVGQKLGLWPTDVPPPEQTQRFKDLAKAADDVARFVGLAAQAFDYLNQSQNPAADSGAAVGRAFRDLPQTLNAANAGATAFLNTLAATGDRTKALEAMASAARQSGNGISAAAHEAAAAQDEQARSSGALVVAVAEQAAAELESANATAQAAQKKTTVSREEQQSIRDRLAAAKEAAAEAERIVKKEAADAERRAEQIAKANEDASKSYSKFTRDVEDIVTDSTRRLNDINEKHGEDWIRITAETQADQTRIYARETEDKERLAEESGRRILELETQLQEVREDRNREAVERGLRLQREADDRAAELELRRDDRQLAQDRRDEDRTRARAQAIEDLAELERRLGAEGAGGAEGADADAARKKAQDESDRKKAADEAERDARKARDLDEENERHKREERDETQRHNRALRDADTDEEKAKEKEKHDDAVAKEGERHDDAKKKIRQQFDDATKRIKDQADEDKRRREDAHKDALDRIKRQFDEQKRRIDESKRDRLDAIKIAEDQQRAADKRADDREDARRTLQQTREKEDFDRRQAEAETRLADDLQKTKDKAAADKTAIEARREADISASNAALNTKIGAIDKARADDLAKFKTDIRTRFRELEQAFGDSMANMDKLIPGRVANLTGNAGKQAAGAVAGLEAAAQVSAPPRGDSDVSGPVEVAPAAPSPEQAAAIGAALAGIPGAAAAAAIGQATQPAFEDHIVGEVADDLGDGRAQNFHVWASGKRTPNGGPYRIGEGAGPVGGGTDVLAASSPTADLLPIVARLQRAIGVAEGLLGGDFNASAGAAAPKPKAGLPPPNGGAEQALAFAAAHMGDTSYIGWCQRFVENAYGTSGRYASAWTAAQALMTNPGGSLAGVPRGHLVFFRPDSTNANFGHVGISRGDGTFVSATNAGVSVDGASRYWSGLFAGSGVPRFRYGGTVPGAPGEEQMILAEPGEVILNQREQTVVRRLLGGGGGLTAAEVERIVVRAVGAAAAAMAAHTHAVLMDGQRTATLLRPHQQRHHSRNATGW